MKNKYSSIATITTVAIDEYLLKISNRRTQHDYIKIITPNGGSINGGSENSIAVELSLINHQQDYTVGGFRFTTLYNNFVDLNLSKG